MAAPAHAARALLFDREAETYDRYRPRYPEALIDRILGPDPEGLEVLDVATGTGIAAVQMAARGAFVLGVELNEGMAAVARRHGIPTVVSSFEAFDADGRRFDRVTCAQAWHWLDPEIATDKVVSLLRPGGQLTLLWLVGHYPDPLADALADTYARVLRKGSPPLMRGYATNRSDGKLPFGVVADSLREHPELTDVQICVLPWTRSYTSAGWVGELRSHSDHAALPERVRERLLTALADTIDQHGGSFPLSGESTLVTAVRR